MRKVAALLSIGLVVGLAPSAFAATKPAPGAKCTKVSTFQQTPKGLLVCDQVKKKKVWRKTTRVEAKFHKKEQVRIQKEIQKKEELQKKSDEAVKAEADRIALEAQAAADAVAKAAADKAATDKAAADAAAKAAADKAAADAAAKAAADKAAADKAAADKAAAEAAAKAAADIPKLVVGGTYFGQDADNPSWNWVAVRISNSASTKLYTHQSFDVLLADSSGTIVDSSFSTNFPILGPGQSAWYTTTEFNTSPISQAVFQQKYSTSPSPMSFNELPSASNARLVTSTYYASRKMVAFTIRNNSSQVLSDSTKCFAVLLNSSNIPVYAIWGRLGKSVLPGGTAEVTIGSDFTFNGQYSSIEISLGPVVR